MEFLFGVVVLLLDVWAIVNVLGSNASGGKKAAWVVGILIFPLIGFLLWYFMGPRSGSKLATR